MSVDCGRRAGSAEFWIFPRLTYRRGTDGVGVALVTLGGIILVINGKVDPHVSGGLVIVLIIVVWLFVLAPLLLRGQKPIRKAGEAFDETRVIHEGGSGQLSSRRRPRVTPDDVRPHRESDEEDYELVNVDDVLIDDRETGDSRLGGVFASTSERFQRRREPEPGPPVTGSGFVDGDVVHELEAAPANEATLELSEAAEPEPEDWDDPAADASHYEFSDAYTSPGDLLHPRAAVDPAVTEEELDREAATEEYGEAHSDLTAEEVEFAQRRRGRGGWDPEADQQNSVTRYQRRQRTLIGLGAAVVFTLILGVILGGWWLLLPAVSGGLTALYLVALRSQVRDEQALRARRIRQLRRARLGVRHAEDAGQPVPRQLRRPGAMVLEVDDESPDFENLDVVAADFHDVDARGEVIDLYRDRRVS